MPLSAGVSNKETDEAVPGAGESPGGRGGPWPARAAAERVSRARSGGAFPGSPAHRECPGPGRKWVLRASEETEGCSCRKK